MMAGPEGSGSSQHLYYTTGAPGSLGSFAADAGWGSSSASFDGRTLITSGTELFVFDGNPPSVSSLAEIGSGFDSFPFLSVGEQQVYFRNLLAEEPHQLWSTDGTTAGTGAFCAAPNALVFYQGSWIGELGTGVVFKARTAAEGVEPYFCHEGETAISLADIAAGSADADPEGFVAVGGWSLFAATDAAGDRELWRTDGTVAGTSLLANLSPPELGPQRSTRSPAESCSRPTTLSTGVSSGSRMERLRARRWSPISRRVRCLRSPRTSRRSAAQSCSRRRLSLPVASYGSQPEHRSRPGRCPRSGPDRCRRGPKR
jgi:ELWxxDGT repeat protein